MKSLRKIILHTHQLTGICRSIVKANKHCRKKVLEVPPMYYTNKSYFMGMFCSQVLHRQPQLKISKI